MSPTIIALSTLAVAKSQLGIVEDRPHHNRGKAVDAYLAAAGLDAKLGDYPWCLAFLVWCSKEATRRVLRGTVGSGEAPFKVTASTSQLREWSRLHGTLKTAPQVGDIGLIRFTQHTGHAFIVERVEGSLLYTIEGNTNTDGSRDGYGVFSRTRTLKQLNATATGSMRFVRY